jgi:hypothetical protein
MSDDSQNQVQATASGPALTEEERLEHDLVVVVSYLEQGLVGLSQLWSDGKEAKVVPLLTVMRLHVETLISEYGGDASPEWKACQSQVAELTSSITQYEGLSQTSMVGWLKQLFYEDGNAASLRRGVFQRICRLSVELLGSYFGILQARFTTPKVASGWASTFDQFKLQMNNFLTAIGA